MPQVELKIWTMPKLEWLKLDTGVVIDLPELRLWQQVVLSWDL